MGDGGGAEDAKRDAGCDLATVAASSVAATARVLWTMLWLASVVGALAAAKPAIWALAEPVEIEVIRTAAAASAVKVFIVRVSLKCVFGSRWFLGASCLADETNMPGDRETRCSQGNRGKKSRKFFRIEPGVVSERYLYLGQEAAELACLEGDVAAVGSGDVAGDRKAEAGVALILVAGVVEAIEGPEHVLAFVGGNAGAVILD